MRRQIVIDEKIRQEIEDVIAEMFRVAANLRALDIRTLQSSEMTKECLDILQADIDILEERLGIQKVAQS